MPSAVTLCYITDRRQFRPPDQQLRLLEKISECAAAGIDLIQLREKDLTTRDLLELAQKAVAALPSGSATKLLINARTDVALACGAHGVHLPAGGVPASEVRSIWDFAGRSRAIVGVSAHSPEEVALAETQGADFVLFAPVFAKEGRGNPRGLHQLHAACSLPRRAAAFMPVLALGGITLENAAQCFAAGASGLAAIRLFQQNAVESVARRLRTVFAEARLKGEFSG